MLGAWEQTLLGAWRTPSLTTVISGNTTSKPSTLQILSSSTLRSLNKQGGNKGEPSKNREGAVLAKSSAQPDVNLATVVKGEKSNKREGAGINSSANPTVNPAIVNPTNTAQNAVLP